MLDSGIGPIQRRIMGLKLTMPDIRAATTGFKKRKTLRGFNEEGLSQQKSMPG